MLVDLVHPPPYGEVPFKHLGLAYVAAGLHRHGLETRYHDISEQLHRQERDPYHELILRLSLGAGDMSDLPNLDLLGEVIAPEHSGSELAATIRALAVEADEQLAEAHLVGLSVNTLTSYFVVALGRRLRERGVKVFLGGPLARIDATSELMLRLGAADALLVGDGDLAAGPLARALLEGAPLDSVPGALWLREGVIARVPPGPPPALDLLPWPHLEGHLLDGFIPVGASRGCPRKCVYCSELGLWPEGARRRQPTRVVAEMEARAKATGLCDVHFHDDLLNSSRSWLEELVVELRGQGLTWESFFEPYRLDRHLLGKMQEAGCRLIKYGVQSFSPEVLRAMRRPTASESVVETIVATYEAGISTHYDMLIGYPGETEDDHKRNLDLIEELYQRTGDGLYFSPNPFYLAVGSALAEAPERFGVSIRYADPSTLAPELARAVAAGPPYPLGYRSGIPRETLMRRMDELADILKRHNKDYLFLGQREAPPPGPQGRRMLPSIEGGSGSEQSHPRDRKLPAAYCLLRLDHRSGHHLSDQSDRSDFAGRNDDQRRLLSPAMSRTSNLRLWPGLGRLAREASTMTEPREIATIARESTVLITGGEPTLDPRLPTALKLCRHLGIPSRLETNGLICARGKVAETLRQAGLGQALVTLLTVEPRTARKLGGIEGCLEMALKGARALIDAGVAVELGLVLSEASIGSADQLADLAEVHLAEIRRLVLMIAPLRGDTAPGLPTPGQIEEATDRLERRARLLGRDVWVEDRR